MMIQNKILTPGTSSALLSQAATQLYNLAKGLTPLQDIADTESMVSFFYGGVDIHIEPIGWHQTDYIARFWVILSESANVKDLTPERIIHINVSLPFGSLVASDNGPLLFGYSLPGSTINPELFEKICQSMAAVALSLRKVLYNN